MKRMILFSCIFHALVLGGLTVANFVWSEPVYYSPKVYKVHLVTLPSDKDQKNRMPTPPDKNFRVVGKKEAARPDDTADMALKRTPKLVEKTPEETVEQPSFETGTPGVKLDVEDFEFPYYLAVIQRKIQQHLTVPYLPGVHYLKTVMYFRIDRSGRIYGMEMQERSNHTMFDLAVRRALTNANPLPPLPDGYKHESLGVHFEFEYVP